MCPWGCGRARAWASRRLISGTVEQDHAGVVRRRLVRGDWRRSLGIGSVPQLRGGHGADGQGGHDQHDVALDRAVQPGLALVQAKAVLPELEVFFCRPSQAGGPDQPRFRQRLAFGDMAVAKGQLAGLQVAAHQQVMARRGGSDPGPGMPPLAPGPLPAERTSRRRLSFSSSRTASAQVTLTPAASSARSRTAWPAPILAAAAAFDSFVLTNT